jgi:hypothetical protein
LSSLGLTPALPRSPRFRWSYEGCKPDRFRFQCCYL